MVSTVTTEYLRTGLAQTQRMADDLKGRKSAASTKTLPAEVSEAAEKTLEYSAFFLKQLWDEIRTSLDRGAEARKFTRLLKINREVLEASVPVLEDIREEVAYWQATAVVDQLGKVLETTKMVLDFIAGFVDKLDAPRPPLPPEVLARASAEAGELKAQNFQSREEVLAWLASRGYTEANTDD